MFTSAEFTNVLLDAGVKLSMNPFNRSSRTPRLRPHGHAGTRFDSPLFTRPAAAVIPARTKATMIEAPFSDVSVANSPKYLRRQIGQNTDVN